VHDLAIVSELANEERMNMACHSRKSWTDSDDQLLKRLANENKLAPEIAATIGKSKSAVRTRAYILRIMIGRPGRKKPGVRRDASSTI
jgi:hypothetical protein